MQDSTPFDFADDVDRGRRFVCDHVQRAIDSLLTDFAEFVASPERDGEAAIRNGFYSRSFRTSFGTISVRYRQGHSLPLPQGHDLCRDRGVPHGRERMPLLRDDHPEGRERRLRLISGLFAYFDLLTHLEHDRVVQWREGKAEEEDDDELAGEPGVLHDADISELQQAFAEAALHGRDGGRGAGPVQSGEMNPHPLLPWEEWYDGKEPELNCFPYIHHTSRPISKI